MYFNTLIVNYMGKLPLVSYSSNRDSLPFIGGPDRKT